jgi:hypothetical protein
LISKDAIVDRADDRRGDARESAVGERARTIIFSGNARRRRRRRSAVCETRAERSIVRSTVASRRVRSVPHIARRRASRAAFERRRARRRATKKSLSRDAAADARDSRRRHRDARVIVQVGRLDPARAGGRIHATRDEDATRDRARARACRSRMISSSTSRRSWTRSTRSTDGASARARGDLGGLGRLRVGGRDRWDVRDCEERLRRETAKRDCEERLRRETAKRERERRMDD